MTSNLFTLPHVWIWVKQNVYRHGMQCYIPSTLEVAFGFLDKDYVEQEDVEEVLNWFITMI